MRRRLGPLAVIALLALPSAAAARPRLGQFVGHSGKVALGVALGAEGSLAYACDGKRVGTWFKGPALKGNHVVLEADAGSSS